MRSIKGGGRTVTTVHQVKFQEDVGQEVSGYQASSSIDHRRRVIVFGLEWFQRLSRAKLF